jgi:hypothetical protein
MIESLRSADTRMPMRKLILCLALAVAAGTVHSESGSPDSFEQLKSMAGEWQAELPGFGKISSTVRLVSNGQAVEETIGTPADNEISVYTRDNRRILLTHFCAMTPDGHQARLETAPLSGMPRRLTFVFRDAVNLHAASAPHMRRVSITFIDHNHYAERWTKTADGKDTEFQLDFMRMSP